MASWTALRQRCESLDEPFRSQAIEFYIEAHKTAEVYTIDEAAILWQAAECIQAVEWDAAHDAPREDAP